jgi:ABC-2 type transport system ATP-binding protein
MLTGRMRLPRILWQVSELAIEVNDLRKSFGEVIALSGISFEVEKGSVLGLLGPNGAGKTTAIRILATILEPTSGSARVLGKDVATQAKQVRYDIGLAGQFAAVDPNLTGRENLRLIGKLVHLPKSSIPTRASQLLEQFGLTDAADRPARTYSGGMRRRLDLAAALVHKPAVLFLDEPTTGLDPQSRLALWEVIRELVNDGTTVLLTTQYLEEADRLADRIAVIDKGKVIANDTSDALKARLGNTVIEVGFNDEETAERAREVLLATGVAADRQTNLVHIASDQGTKQVVETVRALDAAQLAPVSLNVREPSLDDVFLSLTGRAVAEEQS